MIATSLDSSSSDSKGVECDWQASLQDLNTAVSSRAELVLVLYTLIAYGFTWVLGWVYVFNLQHASSSPPLVLIGLAAFGPTISAFITMGCVHRKSVFALLHIKSNVISNTGE